MQFLKNQKTILPSKCNWFRAINGLPPERVKVVIVGQDPYYHIGHATGRAFEVCQDTIMPPTLRNIMKEVGTKKNVLATWPHQGVLLLNAVLTVAPGKPGSHAGRGWEKLTNKIVTLLQDGEPKVFILWGKYAQRKARLINKGHCILMAPHPSPHSAFSGFIGCGHFEKANEFLKATGQEPIKWT